MVPDTSEHTSKVRDFFDDRVAAYDGFYDEPTAFGRWFNRTFRKAVYMRRDQVMVLAARYGCQTLLDVGCGTGRNSVWFVRHGIKRVFGLDISAEMIEEAKLLAAQAGVADRCTFQHGDFLSLPQGQRFDMVCSLGVFDYVERPEPFLRRMAQSADRVIYASFPGWTMVRSPLRKVRYALRGCPTHFYRTRAVETLLQAVGFGHVHVKRVPSGCLGWAVRPEPEKLAASGNAEKA